MNTSINSSLLHEYSSISRNYLKSTEAKHGKKVVCDVLLGMLKKSNNYKVVAMAIIKVLIAFKFERTRSSLFNPHTVQQEQALKQLEEILNKEKDILNQEFGDSNPEEHFIRFTKFVKNASSLIQENLPYNFKYLLLMAQSSDRKIFDDIPLEHRRFLIENNIIIKYPVTTWCYRIGI